VALCTERAPFQRLRPHHRAHRGGPAPAGARRAEAPGRALPADRLARRRAGAAAAGPGCQSLFVHGDLGPTRFCFTQDAARRPDVPHCRHRQDLPDGESGRRGAGTAVAGARRAGGGAPVAAAG